MEFQATPPEGCDFHKHSKFSPPAASSTEEDVVELIYSRRDWHLEDATYFEEGEGVRTWASLEPWGYEGCGRSDARANMYLTILHGRTPAELCGHERKGPSAAARVVPAEQAWLRRSAWNDMFDIGPRVLREALAELPHLAKVWR